VMRRLVDTGEVMRRFGHDLGVTIRREKRAGMTSPMYNLAGRSSLGYVLVHDVADEFVRRMEDVITAEELGARMRAPLMRPYSLGLFIFLEGYLVHREQLRLDGDPRACPPDDAAKTEYVVSWFGRVSRAYRADDELFCGESVLGQQVLTADDASAFRGELTLEPGDELRVKRAFGLLELYALTLHGEQRDGHFYHGPYPAEGGRWTTFHEINDLDNRTLPWADEETVLGVDAVGATRLYSDDIVPIFDMFGTMSVTPVAAGYSTTGLWLRDAAGVRALELDELEAIAQRAQAATSVLFRRIIAWDDDYRTAYGAPLWANHLLPFAELGGVPGIGPWLTERAAAVTAEWLPRLGGDAPASVWPLMAAASADLFRTGERTK
jgi:hypothetical protein